MSKYIKPWRPLLFCSAQSSTFIARMPPGHMSTAQPSELACLPQEPQSHNEAQDLLLLQDYVCKLTHTLRTLEDTHALLQQTELLAGVLSDQDCRNIRTACSCIRSLRTRVEARANVTEREVISRQLQLMQASVQHYPTEELNTADTRRYLYNLLLNTKHSRNTTFLLQISFPHRDSISQLPTSMENRMFYSTLSMSAKYSCIAQVFRPL